MKKLLGTIRGPTMKRFNSKQDYKTPDIFIAAVQRRFGTIQFDLAADSFNAQAARYFDEESDSLKQDWHKIKLPEPRLLWLNPPFGNIEPWAAKCAVEARKGARILFLVPASIGSNWFAEHALGKCKILALNPRLSFDGENCYPKDCMLCCYNIGKPTFTVWHWK